MSPTSLKGKCVLIAHKPIVHPLTISSSVLRASAAAIPNASPSTQTQTRRTIAPANERSPNDSEDDEEEDGEGENTNTNPNPPARGFENRCLPCHRGRRNRSLCYGGPPCQACVNRGLNRAQCLGTQSSIGWYSGRYYAKKDPAVNGKLRRKKGNKQKDPDLFPKSNKLQPNMKKDPRGGGGGGAGAGAGGHLIAT